MKTLTLLTMGFIITSLSIALIINIPYTAFLYALIDDGVDTNRDNFINNAKSEAIYSLNGNQKNISDQSGIEAFLNLCTLNCRNNQLTSLDVSGNTVLTDLSSYNTCLT